jgi:hypothetical protein
MKYLIALAALLFAACGPNKEREDFPNKMQAPDSHHTVDTTESADSTGTP